MSDFGTSGLLIVDPYVHDHILPTLDLSSDKSTLITDISGGEYTEQEIQCLVDSGKKGGCGATCILIEFSNNTDSGYGKAVSAYLKVPIIISATAASTDAPTSSARSII